MTRHEGAKTLPEDYTLRVREEAATERWGLPKIEIKVVHDGRPVGSLSVHQRLLDHEDGPVGHPNIYVDPEHQRKGLATAMYAEVKRRWPDIPIRHSEHASDAAKALNRTLAGINGDLPSGLTFEYVPDRGAEGRGVTGPGAVLTAMLGGKEIGGLGWYTTFIAGPMGHQAGQIEGIFVLDEYQRRGVATELFRRAREIEPRLHHSHSLTEDGKAWSRVTAGARGETPTLTFRNEPGRYTYERVITAYVGGRPVGSLAWLTSEHDGLLAGMITSVHVYEEWQRMGIATALLKRAREIDPRVRHSSQVTDDGAEWAIAVGSKTASAKTVYRGVCVRLDGSDVEDVHGAAAMQAIVLRQALEGSGRGPLGTYLGGSGLGQHWTTNIQVARNFSDPYARSVEPKRARPDGYSGYNIPVVITATVADSDVVSNQDELRDAMVEGVGWTGLPSTTRLPEDEVFVRDGAPVHVVSVEAAWPTGRWSSALKGPQDWKRIGGGMQAAAAYGKDLISRGLRLTEFDAAFARKVIAGTVTAREFADVLGKNGLGVWWGVMGQFGDLADFEDYAWGEETLRKQVEEGYGPDDDFFVSGEIQVVLVAKRPKRGNEPWDPEVHNPIDPLMGNSFLEDGEPVDLVEIRYDAGWGWKSLRADGIRSHAHLASTGIEVYRGLPMALRADDPRAKAFLRALAQGAEGVAKDRLVEMMAGGAGRDQWTGLDNGPRTGAGRWWTTDYSAASQYSTFSPDWGVDQVWAEVILHARIGEDVAHDEDGNGHYWYHVPEGTPLTITSMEVDGPTRAQAARLVSLLDTQKAWHDTEGMFDLDTWRDPGLDDGHMQVRRYVWPLNMRTEARVLNTSGPWYHGCSLRRAEEVKDQGFGHYTARDQGYGPGLYLTNVRATAEGYAARQAKAEGRPTAVLQVDPQMHNPFVSQHGEPEWDVKKAYPDESGSTMERLVRHGHDGIIIPFSRDTWAIVFDPAKVTYLGHEPLATDKAAVSQGVGASGYQVSLESAKIGAVEETMLKTYPRPVQDLVRGIERSLSGREMAERVFRSLSGGRGVPVALLSNLDLAQYLYGKDWTWADVLKRET